MSLTKVMMLLAVLSSCIDSFEPEVGPLQSNPCTNEDSDPSKDVSYRDDIITQIFLPEFLGCLQCHAPDAPTPIGFEVGGLDLSNYASLMRGGANSDGIAIIAGQPCESILLQKVNSGPPFGARMPLGAPPYLSADLLQLLHDWVAEGAKDN